MIGAAIKKIEAIDLSLWQVLFLFYLSSFFRGFLEVFVNAENFGRVTSPIDLFFHYPFWFFGVFLSAIIIIYFFTKESISKISGIVAIFSFVITIPIIVDLCLGGGGLVKYSFIIGSWGEIIQSFFSFAGATDSGSFGATVGLRVEGLLIGALFFGYVFYKTKNVFKSAISAFLIYLVVFLFAISPTILHFGYNVFTGGNAEISGQATQNFFWVEESANSTTASAKDTVSVIFAIFFLCVDVALGAIIFYFYDKNKFWAVIKNFRFLRIIFYCLFAFVGLFWGVTFAGRFFINSLFDFLLAVAVLLSGTFAGLFSIWENDEVDVEIDKISNSESVTRPLASGVFNLKEWVSLKYLFLFIAINFAFLAGFYQFVFTLLFVGVYHIYSAPPLRLKRFIGISSLLIAINGLIAVWMGFFISAGTENFSDFPAKYSLGILAIIFLVENVKNIKDIEGDRQNGIKTLPVVLGEKNGKLVVGSMVFLATLLAPILFFMNVWTFFTAVFFGAIFFLLITRENYEEKYVFIFYFIFAIVITYELIAIYGFPKL